MVRCGLLLCALVACGRHNIEIIDAPADATDADAGADAAIDPSLVVWYELEDDPADGTIDDSAGGDHPATCIAGIACGTHVAGKRGMGMQLVPQQHYQVASDAALMTGQGFTASMWINVRMWPVDPAAAYFFTKRYGSIHNSWAIRFNDIGEAQFETATTVPQSQMLTYGFVLPLATWIHVAVTWDAATKRLYINGAAVVQAPAAVAFDAGELLIGADIDNTTVMNWGDGSVDDIRLYSRALSAAEVMALYEQP